MQSKHTAAGNISSKQLRNSPRSSTESKTKRMMKSPKATGTKKSKMDTVTFNFKDNEFYSNVSVPEDNFEMPQDISPHIDYFNKFFSSDLVQLIVMASNQYSMQVSGKLDQTTDAEIRALLAMKLLMSIISIPTHTDYWSKSTRIKNIASIMPLKKIPDSSEVSPFRREQ